MIIAWNACGAKEVYTGQGGGGRTCVLHVVIIRPFYWPRILRRCETRRGLMFYMCSCETIAHVSSWERSFVPIRVISDGQSIFATLLDVAKECVTHRFYANTCLFRPISLSWNRSYIIFVIPGYKGLSIASFDFPQFTDIYLFLVFR